MRKIKIPTQEERRLRMAEEELAFILFDSMQDKIKISQLEEELGNALFDIMKMQMGGM